ncbi:MAG TPA: DeoR/GlpR family DNA-binding transcription regulator [Aggregatilinea sp.]|jgi:DeoR family fructose operon transcriptional repressor|uniref:DeoR/GlpR family DNA-binding transcription regulator n=1 Tax=Aggregatilinea sp. TaxID=2806333 RepID=UPI002C07F23B|nr:DeoR/GlpR family DNA-binding transcription regulator [Aggregatilinea sp.]HML21903.1 DeoR/GlpR family DNA-binding transcription regulator [Aggregatilinea sp.]
MSEPLFVEERRRAILERLNQRGRVAVKELSDEMQVSAVTIRQDLRALEQAGRLERTYGGAVIRTVGAPVQELSFNVRLIKSRHQKEAIALAAVALVQEGYSIALDSSTTSYAMVPYLKRLEKLTVVTNSLIVAQAFLDSPHIQVLLPGGRVRRDSISLVGEPDTLPKINLNIGFFGARGLDLAVGATEVDGDEAILKQATMARCLKTILLVDASKWGQVAPYTMLPPQEISTVITSSGAPGDMVSALEMLGAKVTVVPDET